ncbi:sugar ABC transporter substrate-binding protein [Saccharobesus litoralis]|uniref:sugar ABC transporter substrate-binding protein n=1 Tax=Saccharobesus litoralis TaxID=2172099 RepID=UPI00131EFE95|nr:extracellular solute-binding protein [Saccharobesus litoralis]
MSQPKVELNLWHSQGYTQAFWQSLVDEFTEKQPDIQIQVSVIPWKTLNPSLTQSVMAGDAPEMVMFQSDNLGIKDIFKLSAVPNNWLANSLLPEMEFFIKRQGKAYGIPLTHGNHLVLYYNKQIIKQPAMDWQQLTQQAKTLAKQYQFMAFDYYSAYGFVSFLNAFYSDFAVNNNLNLNSPHTIAALEFFKESTQNGVFDPECGFICARESFLTGKYAYAINGDWEYARMSAELGDDLGVALLPTVAGKRIVSMKSALLLVFPNQSIASSKQQALFKFSQFLQSKTVADRVYHKTQSMPTHSAAMQDLIKQGGQNFQWFIEQLRQSKAMPSSTEMASVWDSIEKGLELYITGELSAEQAAKYMQRRALREKQKIKSRNDSE